MASRPAPRHCPDQPYIGPTNRQDIIRTDGPDRVDITSRRRPTRSLCSLLVRIRSVHLPSVKHGSNKLQDKFNYLFIYLFIYLLTEHLHFQRNITAGQQGTNK